MPIELKTCRSKRTEYFVIENCEYGKLITLWVFEGLLLSRNSLPISITLNDLSTFKTCIKQIISFKQHFPKTFICYKLLKMKETKRQSIEDMVGEEATSMLQNTTCLAIGNIFLRNHPLLKTLWCFTFILCTILTVRQMYNLSKAYFSYPLNTVIRLQNEPIDFPSITFCNLNPLRRSKINMSNPSLQKLLYYMENRTFVKDNSNEMDSRMVDEITFKELILNETEENRFKMGHQMHDLILQCSFLGEKCNISRLFTPIITNKFGNCFIFNPYNMYNQSYIKNKRNRNEGLFITFYLQSFEYLKNFISSTGVRFHVHEPNSIEQPAAYGMTLPPGFQISLGIKPTRIRRLRQIRKNCEDGISFRRTYNSTYTREACYQVCFQNHIFQKCRCYDIGFRVYNVNIHDSICKSNNELKCLISTFNAFKDYKQNCDCKVACNTTIYNIHQSFAEWPTHSYEERFFNDLKDVYPRFNLTQNDPNQARMNLTNIILYIQDESYQEIYQIRSYLMDSFLSDIGGTLSLYLGFSVLTGFEIFEIFSLIVAYFYGAIFKKNN